MEESSSFVNGQVAVVEGQGEEGGGGAEGLSVAPVPGTVVDLSGLEALEVLGIPGVPEGGVGPEDGLGGIIEAVELVPGITELGVFLEVLDGVFVGVGIGVLGQGENEGADGGARKVGPAGRGIAEAPAGVLAGNEVGPAPVDGFLRNLTPALRAAKRATIWAPETVVSASWDSGLQRQPPLGFPLWEETMSLVAFWSAGPSRRSLVRP